MKITTKDRNILRELATLEVDKQMMGQECAKLLLRMINGDSNAATPSRVTIPVRLIPRPSAACKN